MEIITPDFSISQEKDQALDLHIAKEENGEMLVKNDGDKITVKTKKSENESEVKQISSELVAISSNSDIDIVEDSDVMLTFMEKNNISATFTLSSEKVDWPKIQKSESEKFVTMQTNIDYNLNNQPDLNKNSQIVSELQNEEVDNLLLE
jgi:hypothetical protein